MDERARGPLVATSFGLIGLLLLVDFDGTHDAEAGQVHNRDGSINPFLTAIDTRADTLLSLLHSDHTTLTAVLETLPPTDPDYRDALRLEEQCEELRSSAFSIKAQTASFPRSSMSPEVMRDSLTQLDVERKRFTDEVEALRSRLRARGLA